MDSLRDNWLVCFKNVSHKRQGKADYFFQIKKNKTPDIQMQHMSPDWALDWKSNCQKGYYGDSWQNLNIDSILHNIVLVLNFLNMNSYCGHRGKCHVPYTLDYLELKSYGFHNLL